MKPFYDRTVNKLFPLTNCVDELHWVNSANVDLV